MSTRRLLLASQNSVGGGSSLITFTVDGVEYQAVEGMTWRQFVASEYNTVNALGDKLFRDVDTIQYGQVYSDWGPDGKDYFTEYRDVYKTGVLDLVFSDERIEKDINYYTLS